MDSASLFGILKSLADRFSSSGKASSFTPEVYSRLKPVFLIFVLSLPLCFFLVKKARKNFKTLRDDFFSLCRRIEKGLKSDKPALGITALITFSGFLVRLRFLSHDMEIDEAANYVYYASRPFFSVFSMYTLPNNHILYTFFMKCSTLLFGVSPQSIRLPAFISGILIIPLSYFFSLSIYRNKTVGFLTAALVAVSPYLIEYSVNGRGYTTQCVFFLIAWLFAIDFKTKLNMASLLGFSFFSALGFITIPTMLFGYSVMLIWLAIERPHRHLFLSIFLTGAVTLIGYLPAIIFVGPEVILHNPYVSPQSLSSFFSELPSFFNSVFKSWNWSHFPFLQWILGMGVIVSSLLHYKISWHRVSPITAFLLGITTVFILNHRVPVNRIWVPFIPVYLAVSVSGLAALLSRLKIKKQHPAILYFCIAVSLTLGLKVPEFKELTFSNRTESLLEKVVAELKDGDLLIYSGHQVAILDFYFTSRKWDKKFLGEEKPKRVFFLSKPSELTERLTELREKAKFSFSKPKIEYEKEGLSVYVMTSLR